MCNQCLHRGAHAQERQRIELEDTLQRYAEDLLGEDGALGEAHLIGYGLRGQNSVWVR